MTLPGWLLSKTALIVGVSTIVFGAVGLWYRGQLKDAADKAVAEMQTKIIKEMEDRQQIVIDSAVEARIAEVLRNNELIRAATPIVTTYETQRARFDPNVQPASVPAGMVLVPKEYVEAADDALKQIPIMIAMVHREREIADIRIAASDSMITLLTARNAQMEILVKEAGPSLKDKAQWAGIGAVITYGTIKLLEALARDK